MVLYFADESHQIQRYNIIYIYIYIYIYFKTVANIQAVMA